MPAFFLSGGSIMARYKVLARSYINNRIVEPGEVV